MRLLLGKLSLLFVALTLSGCGDGWEAHLTKTEFPYGNQRTAGSGVVYVRANMMPQKELKVSHEMSGEKVFSDSLGKTKPVEKKSTPAVPVSSADDEADDMSSASDVQKMDADLNAGRLAMVVPAAGGDDETLVVANALSNDDLNAGIDDADLSRETVYMAQKAIVAPKRDILTTAERGQLSLDEIYNGVY